MFEFRLPPDWIYDPRSSRLEIVSFTRWGSDTESLSVALAPGEDPTLSSELWLRGAQNSFGTESPFEWVSGDTNAALCVCTGPAVRIRTLVVRGVHVNVITTERSAEKGDAPRLSPTLERVLGTLRVPVEEAVPSAVAPWEHLRARMSEWIPGLTDDEADALGSEVLNAARDRFLFGLTWRMQDRPTVAIAIEALIARSVAQRTLLHVRAAEHLALRWRNS